MAAEKKTTARDRSIELIDKIIDAEVTHGKIMARNSKATTEERTASIENIVSLGLIQTKYEKDGQTKDVTNRVAGMAKTIPIAFPARDHLPATEKYAERPAAPDRIGVLLTPDEVAVVTQRLAAVGEGKPADIKGLTPAQSLILNNPSAILPIAEKAETDKNRMMIMFDAGKLKESVRAKKARPERALEALKDAIQSSRGILAYVAVRRMDAKKEASAER